MDQLRAYGHGGDWYSAKETLAEMTGEAGVEILDFSANVNPLGLPEGVKQALRDEVDAFSLYPDPHCRALVTAIAEKEGVPRDWILCGNGAADLIYRLVSAVKPKKAMVLAPTFAEYEEALHTVSCQVVRYPLARENHFLVEEGLLEALEEDLDMLFLCNPNNPTGQLTDQTLLRKIVSRCGEKGIFLIVDECFMEFLEEEEQDRYSVKADLQENHQVILLKAFTKIYAMAGLRLGYCITGNRSLLESVAAAGQPWSVSVPAQVAGLQALKETRYLAESRALIQRERSDLLSALAALGIQVLSTNANYLFFHAGLVKDQPLHSALLAQGILIRNCENYPGLGQGDYRICIRQREENQRLLAALRRIKE